LFDVTIRACASRIDGNMRPSSPRGAGQACHLTLRSISIDRLKGSELTPRSRSPD
jgi:hypothetical protein